jgi:hypothetical protein
VCSTNSGYAGTGLYISTTPKTTSSDKSPSLHLQSQPDSTGNTNNVQYFDRTASGAAIHEILRTFTATRIQDRDNDRQTAQYRRTPRPLLEVVQSQGKGLVPWLLLVLRRLLLLIFCTSVSVVIEAASRGRGRVAVPREVLSGSYTAITSQTSTYTSTSRTLAYSRLFRRSINRRLNHECHNKFTCVPGAASNM